MGIDRRDALRLITGGGLMMGMGAAFPSLAQAATPDLAVMTGPSIEKNVRAAIDAMGGMSKFVSKNDVVVIKPNMGFGNAPIKTTTTDPMVVKTIAVMALEAGAKRIMVCDRPCHKPKIALQVNGIKQELSKLQDTFVYLFDDPKLFAEVSIPQGVSLKKAPIARDILESDVIINVPVAKSHGSAKVSFGMKNWMGVVNNPGSWHIKFALTQSIADIATFVKPKLTVLDATRALVTGGPGGPGKISKLDTIVAGINPVALDAYALTLAPWGGNGYKPEEIDFLVKAAKHGIGSYKLDGLNIMKKAV